MCVQSHIKSDLSDNDSTKTLGCLALVGIKPDPGMHATPGREFAITLGASLH
jgi:hypothetical protein